MSFKEDKDEIQHDWHKITRTATKAGLREGVSDGRDSNFQKSFDEGFSRGFKNGFAAGQYSGAFFIGQKDSKEFSIRDNLLENPRRGWCEICKNPNLLENASTAHLAEIQTKAANHNLSTLHSNYFDTELFSNYQLPSNLN